MIYNLYIFNRKVRVVQAEKTMTPTAAQVVYPPVLVQRAVFQHDNPHPWDCSTAVVEIWEVATMPSKRFRSCIEISVPPPCCGRLRCRFFLVRVWILMG